MPYVKELSYRDIPFSSETPVEDFYMYDIVRRLYAKCENSKDEIIKIRTVGLLKNKRGCFYLKEIATTHDLSAPPDPKKCIHVSMAYMHSPISASSLPYPVQIIGKLQWNGHPVIFAQIIQPLNASVATLLHETMVKATTIHSCKHPIDLDELDKYLDQNLG